MGTRPFNPLDYLHNDEEIADYLTSAYQDEDPNVFVVALGHVIRQKGVATIAERSGLARESLYKTISGRVRPKWDTIHRLLKALDVSLHVAR